eukprot:INCI5894.2.p1 GENE.INCI5894.2~~INCI5894.2.p1  ORF type:complete len:1495 (+),score=178.39 INCI5894.2:102-4586(+)
MGSAAAKLHSLWCCNMAKFRHVFFFLLLGHFCLHNRRGMLFASADFTARPTCSSCMVDYSDQINAGPACCDAAFFSNGLSCEDLEQQRGWDCSGCACHADPPCTSCHGSDCSQSISFLGDGTCDDEFDCLAFGYDNGDCLRSSCGACDVSYATRAAVDEYLCCDHAFYRDGVQCSALQLGFADAWNCSGCACPEPAELDCDGAPGVESFMSWIGDGICDSGQWGTNLNCEAFSFDGGDCGNSLLPCPASGADFSSWLTDLATSSFPFGSGLCLCQKGVYCSASGIPYSLNFNEGDLSGSIPAAICSLTHLQAIYLADNALTGTVPPCLASMSAMSQIRLSRNELSGQLPISIGSTNQLRHFYVEDCGLAGPIPSAFGSMGMVEKLILYNNQLSGTIPSSLGSLGASLLHLEVDGNQLSGTTPHALGSLSHLGVLELYANALTGTMPPTLGSLSSLEFLKIFDNRLTGTVPLAMCSLSSIIELYPYQNTITGTLPQCFGSLSSMEKLGFYDTTMSGTLPSSLGSLSQLLKFLIFGAKFSGTLPASLASLESLVKIGFQGNRLSGTVPEAVGSLTNMEQFILNGNYFRGTLPASIGSATALRYMDLSRNQLSGQLPASIGSLDLLSTLQMDLNRFSGTIPSAIFIAGMDNAQEISLALNQLTGTIPAFGLAPMLSFLDLSANQLTGTLPDTFFAVAPALVFASVANNALTGSIPELVQNRNPIMSAFMCSSNQLTGRLPFFPNATVFFAASNAFNAFGPGWCNANSAMSCDLSNCPNLPCTLSCDGHSEIGSTDLDVARLCHAPCACPANLSSVGDPHMYRDPEECQDLNHGAVCSFKCDDGFQPGILAATESQASSTSSAPTPTHVVTCNDGNWLNVDADGSTHGCIPQSCHTLTTADLPYAVEGSCASTPHNYSCLVQCIAGTARVGSATIRCDTGQWAVGDTACVPSTDVFANFNCQALTEELLPNVETDACINTPGRCNIGGTDGIVYYFGRDFLDRDVCSCNYTCQPGYHASLLSPVVDCDLGQWRMPDLARCSPRSCEEFWTNWSECSGFCASDPDPGVETRTFWYSEDERDDVLVAVGGDETRIAGACAQVAKGTVETRACTSRPRCGILSCDDLWSAWTPCPTLCLGGTEARTFDFSTLLGNSSDFENDTNARVQLGSGRMIDTLTIESFSMMACAVSFGEVQNRSCDDGEGHPNCAVALGSTTAALVIAVAVGISAAIARRRSVVVSRLHSTKRGRRFLRAAGFNVRDAMRTYEKAAQLEKRFPDAPFLSIWFAMDGGKRTIAAARKVLELASVLRSRDQRTSTSEALEIANWRLYGKSTDSLHKVLAEQCADRATLRAAVVETAQHLNLDRLAKSRSSTTHKTDANASRLPAEGWVPDQGKQAQPYIHLAVATRWIDSDAQLYVVQELLRSLPPAFGELKFYPPATWPRVGFNPLQLAGVTSLVTVILIAGVVALLHTSMLTDDLPPFFSLLQLLGFAPLKFFGRS